MARRPPGHRERWQTRRHRSQAPPVVGQEARGGLGRRRGGGGVRPRAAMGRLAFVRATARERQSDARLP